MTRSLRLGELARRVGGTVQGDPERQIAGIATLDQASGNELSFFTHAKYRKAAEASAAAAILVGPKTALAGRDLLQAPEPYLALAQLLEVFHPPAAPRPEISPDARIGNGVQLGQDVSVAAFAVIGEGSELGDRVVIGAGSFLGAGCRIGHDSELKPRVVLYDGTRIGQRCLIHSGVVLGADGYGFATSNGKHRKVPQVGSVLLEDDVEIGANSAVDRAMLGQTLVGRGTKIDDLVMVAHGVRIGENSLLAGQAGVAGSSTLGSNTILAGQVGVGGHLEIGDGVTVAAKSAVLQDLASGAFVSGIPAADHAVWRRSQALTRKLPDIRRELRELGRRLSALEQRLQGED